MQTKIAKRPSGYRGRFAPSPSGFLHFGSLVAAAASFFQAKAMKGKWLVRIEDIDPPREQAGASQAILKTLETHHLQWDEPPLFQSLQHERYHTLLSELSQKGDTYYCNCTRKMIKAIGGFYQGHCKLRNNSANNAAIRLINQSPILHFEDGVQGHVSINPALAREDYIIHRRDGLFAYQLAVVADDIYQGITEVVRGNDLLIPTARQIHLIKHLNQNVPNYAHVPLAVTKEGFKLSKQNKAAPLDNKTPAKNIYDALNFLGQSPPKELIEADIEEVIRWGTENWRLAKVPKKEEVAI